MILNNQKGFSPSKILLLIVLCWFVYLGGFRFSTFKQQTELGLKKIVELYRGIEALYGIKDLRFNLEICMNANNGYYDTCFDDNIIKKFNEQPNSHFLYKWEFFGRQEFVIGAKRNKLDNGDPKNKIFMLQKNGRITRSGEGLYSFLR